MILYEKFLGIDSKKPRRVVNFLIENCSTCKDVFLIFIELSSSGNNKYTDEVFLSIKNKISLNKLYDEIKQSNSKNKCQGCELCNIEVFKEKKQKVKKMVKELKYLSYSNLMVSLNKVLSENFDSPLLVKKTRDGKYIYEYEFRNLYQKIIFSIVEEFKENFSSSLDLKNYFIQIAEILVSTTKFVNDIKSIRDNFMEWKGTFYHKKDNTPYGFIGTDIEKNPGIFTEYVNSYEKFKNLHEVIYSEIEKLRDTYKLSPRWRGWLHNILSKDFENDKSELYNSLPDGSILSNLKISKNGNGKVFIIKEPVIVGDETREDKKIFEKKTGQVIDLEITNFRRKPISEFEKQLRWYKLKEEGNNYYNIFDEELDSHIGDWGEFKNYKNYQGAGHEVLIDGREKKYYEKMGTNRIKIGVKKIKDRIYKEYK